MDTTYKSLFNWNFSTVAHCAPPAVYNLTAMSDNEFIQMPVLRPRMRFYLSVNCPTHYKGLTELFYKKS